MECDSLCSRAPQMDREIYLRTLATQNSQRKRKLALYQAVGIVNVCRTFRNVFYHIIHIKKKTFSRDILFDNIWHIEG